MKRGTPRHPKMYALAEALGIPLPYAVGIMEMLWHYAAVNTPRGDIGSQPDEAIKQACVFARKATVLVDALVSSGWLDRDPEYRLILHDWPDHCEGVVIKLLEHRKHDFLPIYGKSTENRRKISRDSPASREAKAKAKADFEVIRKSDTDRIAEFAAIDPRWLRAGFSGPGDFEGWFRAVYKAHPARGSLRLAQDTLLEFVMKGQVTKSAFEAGYAAWRESREWKRDRGRFIPQLPKFCSDEGWAHPPIEPVEERGEF